MNHACKLILLTLLLAAPLPFMAGAAHLQPAAEEAPTSVRFTAIDITLDPMGQPLGAWQLNVAAIADGVTIVGIEGGDHPAYADAPYYDPAAIQRNRAIIAAYSTDADLPIATTRAARIHLMIEGDQRPDFSVTLTTAADALGEPLDAQVSWAYAPNHTETP